MLLRMRTSRALALVALLGTTLTTGVVTTGPASAVAQVGLAQ